MKIVKVSAGELCSEVLNDYGTIRINLIAYYCTIINGEISISVHDKFKWIKINDLLKYDLLTADIPIAKKVMEDHK